MVDRILLRIDKLGEFPSMARVGQVESPREWVVPRLPYIVVYQVEDEPGLLTVVAVFHGAQDRDDK